HGVSGMNLILTSTCCICYVRQMVPGRRSPSSSASWRRPPSSSSSSPSSEEPAPPMAKAKLKGCSRDGRHSPPLAQIGSVGGFWLRRCFSISLFIFYRVSLLPCHHRARKTKGDHAATVLK
uniref:Uncharacterized protein n=1 Tax=Aegilops tauschii subsp. strangulata TaxID=200361 RepID=A0A453RA57_AEGTS